MYYEKSYYLKTHYLIWKINGKHHYFSWSTCAVSSFKCVIPCVAATLRKNLYYMCTLKAYWEFNAEKGMVSNVGRFCTVLLFTLAVQENKTNSEQIFCQMLQSCCLTMCYKKKKRPLWENYNNSMGRLKNISHSTDLCFTWANMEFFNSGAHKHVLILFLS